MVQEKAVVVDFDRLNEIFLFVQFTDGQRTNYTEYFAFELEYDHNLINTINEFVGAPRETFENIGLSTQMVNHIKDGSALEFIGENGCTTVKTTNPVNKEEEIKLTYNTDNLSLVVADSVLSLNNKMSELKFEQNSGQLFP